MTNISLPDYALEALAVLEEAGFEAWCVGGCVRDLIMGRTAADIDIASSAPWQQAKEAFIAAGYRVFETGARHGTITVVSGKQHIEVTMFRIDGFYSDRRHPDTVSFAGNINDDLARRDFTINAVAYHPNRGLRDPFNGCVDMQRKKIRAVGAPEERFSEDALRILRACRFASQLGFTIEGNTLKAAHSCSELLRTVSAERVACELEKFVCGEYIHDALMETVDILSVVAPEIAPMKNFDQKTPYHIYDVLEHTAYVMENVPSYPLVRWAALLHDIGKPKAFFVDQSGIGHFYGHAAYSVEIAEPLMVRLKLPVRFSKDVLLLVRRHDDIVAPTKKAVRRMLQKLDGRVELFRALCDLKRGDALAQAPHCRDKADVAEELRGILDSIINDNDAFTLADLAIDGHDVLRLGIPAGPRVGIVLDAALHAVIDEQVDNEHEALLAFINNL